MFLDYFASVCTAKTKADAVDPLSASLVSHALNCAGIMPDEVARDSYRAAVHAEPRYTGEMIKPNLDSMRALALLGFSPALLDLLPEGSALLEIEFRLEKAYLSRDDALFYPTENPVRKDWVFKVPFVSGASWKGSLRAAAVDGMLLREPKARWVEERLELFKLFGDEKGGADEQEQPPENGKRAGLPLAAFLDQMFGPELAAEFHKRLKEHFRAEKDEEIRKKGRLRCLPSFFDAIDLDVINPRNRKTRAGTEPITMETVPVGAAAQFTLLYVPFDLRPDDLTATLQRDWELLAEAVVRMLRYIGFGAKKSSGHGKARNEVTGSFRWRLGEPRAWKFGRLEGRPEIESLLGLAARFGGRQ